MHHIGIPENQLEMINNLITSDRFLELKDKIQRDPESIPELVEYVHSDYPELHVLFSQNPQLLISLLSGQLQNLDDEIDDEIETQEAERQVSTAINLTVQDRENIVNVA